MPTYTIKGRNQTAEFLQAMLGALGESGIKYAFNQAAEGNELERKKELLKYKQDLEIPNFKDTPLAVYENRYSSVIADLQKKKDIAAMSGDPKALKEAERAEREANTLLSYIQEKKQKHIQEQTKQKLEMDLDTARLEKTQEETQFLRDVKPTLVKTEIAKGKASTAEALARTKKILEAVSEKEPSEFNKNYTSQLNKTSAVTDSLEQSGHLMKDEKDLDLYLSLLPVVIQENQKNRRFNLQEFVMRSISGSPIQQQVLERLRARQQQ